MYFHRHLPIWSLDGCRERGAEGLGGGIEARVLCSPQMKEQQMQAEYQTHLKEQYYLDQINKDKEESQASLEGANERLEGVKRTKEAQGREASEAMQAMEVAHMRAAEELENLYERKLAAEAARFEALRQEKEDMQCQFEVCALAPTRVPSCSTKAHRGSHASPGDRRSGYLRCISKPSQTKRSCALGSRRRVVKQSRAPQTCSTRPVPCDHNTKRCCGRCAARELLRKDAHAHTGSAVGWGIRSACLVCPAPLVNACRRSATTTRSLP